AIQEGGLLTVQRKSSRFCRRSENQFRIGLNTTSFGNSKYPEAHVSLFSLHLPINEYSGTARGSRDDVELGTSCALELRIQTLSAVLRASCLGKRITDGRKRKCGNCE